MSDKVKLHHGPAVSKRTAKKLEAQDWAISKLIFWIIVIGGIAALFDK